MRRGRVRTAQIGLAAICAAVTGASHASASLYNLAGSPRASFVWSPQLPQIGETITLRSTSTELGGRITKYAWDFHDNGPFGAFEEGAPVASASFATPAPHVIRLRVTDQNGASNIASESVQMARPPASAGLMYPFPIVRIMGRVFAFRVTISRLAVEAGAGALITLSCTQHRCPIHFKRRTSASKGGRLIWTRFPRFERSFPAGVALTIRVSATGEIGAYTRFAIRRRRFPARLDSCLDPSGVRPIACPAP
jgi:hypothetical protein